MVNKDQVQDVRTQGAGLDRVILLLMGIFLMLAMFLISRELTWLSSMRDQTTRIDTLPAVQTIGRLEEQSLSLFAQITEWSDRGGVPSAMRTELLERFLRTRGLWESLPEAALPPDQLLDHQVDVQLERFERMIRTWAGDSSTRSVPNRTLVAQTMQLHTTLHDLSEVLHRENVTAHNTFVAAQQRAIQHAVASTVGIGMLFLLIGVLYRRQWGKQNRVISTLDRFAHLSSNASGQELFEALVRYLGDALGVDYVFIGLLDRNHGSQIETLAVYGHGQLQGNIRYNLEGTPCANLLQRDVCVYSSGVQEQFPEDQLLRDMGVNAYMGTTLHSGDGVPLGILVLLNAESIEPKSSNDALIKLASSRAEIELQRMQSEHEREHMLEELEARIELRTRDMRRSNQRLQEEIEMRTELERQQYQARLLAEESSAAKGVFITHASHEIRTHINGLLGMLSLLEEREFRSEDQEHIATALESGNTLLSLINDLLDYSKIEAGQLRVDQVDFDLKTLLWEISDLFSARPRKQGIAFGIDIADDTPLELRGDVGRLRQILSNLVDNAWKFTDSGRIEVRAVRATLPGHSLAVRLEVNDTGIGIAAADTARLFQPFSQADQSTARHFGGTGLGLAISAQLCQLMGGELRVDSTPGEGSRFWMTLPFEPAKAPIASRQRRLPGKPLDQLRILVVDDSAVSRTYLVGLLESWHIDCVDVASGEQALAVIEKAEPPFDAVIMDRVMPGIDGVELAERISAQPGGDKLALIMVSRFGGPVNGHEAMRAGVSKCLNKPVSQSELFDALVSVLGDRRQAAQAQGAGDSTSWRVLVAEDNKVNQRVALGMLARLGYSADLVENGQQALEALQRRHYSLVLMDCQMPEVDGYEATTRIRQLEGTVRHTPIVAMTAHALSNEREKCLAVGMDDYLAKPVRIDQLRKTIEYWCGMESGDTADDAPAADPSASGDEGDDLLDLGVLDALREIMGNELRPLIDTYLADTSARLTSLHADLDRGDLQGLAETAHTLKGSSRNMGAGRLGALSSELYEHARAGDDSDALASRLVALDVVFATLTLRMEGYRAGLGESDAEALS